MVRQIAAWLQIPPKTQAPNVLTRRACDCFFIPMRWPTYMTFVLGCCVFGVLAVGCGHRKGSPYADRSAKGSIPIVYLYGESDRENPPTGFFVQRAETPNGPFRRLQDKPVPPPARLPEAGPVMIYRDQGLPVGSRWYYFLEVVDSEGRARKATPVVSAQVLLPATGQPPVRREQAPTAKDRQR